MATSYTLTEDGVEEQFQVNHLSHHLLITKLLPLLESTAKSTGNISRVVCLSSFAHNFISLTPFTVKFDSLDSVNRSFGAVGGSYLRYSQAKLANILFVRELNKKSSLVQGVAVHPGFVNSSLYASQFGMTAIAAQLFITVEEGAYSSLYAATSPEIVTKNLWGAYLVPFAKVKQTTAYGKDPKLAEDLWNLSTALTRKFK